METNRIARLFIGLILTYFSFLNQPIAQVQNNLEVPTSIRADGNAPDSSAMLDVQAIKKGVLVPRMDSADRTDILNPATGLLVFDTDTETFWYYGATWLELSISSEELESNSNIVSQNIPDNDPTGISSAISLTGNRVIEGSTVIEVCLDITHTYVEDLNITLKSPDGTTIDLSSGNGGGGNDYSSTCFRADAFQSILDGQPPFNSNYLPEGNFADFNGKGISGTWTLEITDNFSGDFGTLNSWSLRILNGSSTHIISDDDGDSHATVEALPDEDAFRVVLSGVEPLNISMQGTATTDIDTKMLGQLALGGTTNVASGTLSAVVAGNGNQSIASNTFIGGGISNLANDNRAAITGGNFNRVSADDAFIGGGTQNQVIGEQGAIVGGAFNQASGRYSFVGGGTRNTAPSFGEAVFGLYPTIYTPSGVNFWSSNDRVFAVGNGSSTTNRSNAFTILKNGNVGIENDDPETPLHILGGSDTRIDAGGYFQTGSTAGLNINMDDNEIMARSNGSVSTIFINREGGDIVLGTLGDGDVGIGRTPTTNDLEVNGTASKSSSGDWLANSDARLKKNIVSLEAEEVLRQILQLQGITYEWDDQVTGNERPEGIQYGFTAQNIQKVFPHLVEEDTQGYLQTAYGTYDAMYVEAIRALVAQNEQLKATIEQLQKQDTARQQQLDRVEAMLNELYREPSSRDLDEDKKE